MGFSVNRRNILRSPACAGKSNCNLHGRFDLQDHPRVCGEKDASKISDKQDAGSPPRVRGKGKHQRNDEVRAGITPACAGKSMPMLSPILPSAGSPPRVRGKVLQLRTLPSVNGITPACAGKSQNHFAVVLVSQDHPRVCGEKPKKLRDFYFFMGSPPRVRGKVVGGNAPRQDGGITPACAGKRLCADC